MTTTGTQIPTAITDRLPMQTASLREMDDEGLEFTPCGDEVVTSRYDTHVNACEDCDAVALAREAADLAWDLYHR